MLIWIRGCNTKEISVNLRKSLGCIRHLAQSFFRTDLSNRCDNVLKTTRDSWILLERRVELAHKLSPIRRHALFLLNYLQRVPIVALNIPSDYLLMILFFECFDYYLSFLGWQVLFKFSFEYYWGPFLQNFKVIFVVLAWGSQCTLWTSLFN